MAVEHGPHDGIHQSPGHVKEPEVECNIEAVCKSHALSSSPAAHNATLLWDTLLAYIVVVLCDDASQHQPALQIKCSSHCSINSACNAACSAEDLCNNANPEKWDYWYGQTPGCSPELGQCAKRPAALPQIVVTGGEARYDDGRTGELGERGKKHKVAGEQRAQGDNRSSGTQAGRLAKYQT